MSIISSSPIVSPCYDIIVLTIYSTGKRWMEEIGN
nr:MAG TPA_asm: hypothetical protein [Bacteriophage sp.]